MQSKRKDTGHFLFTDVAAVPLHCNDRQATTPAQQWIHIQIQLRTHLQEGVGGEFRQKCWGQGCKSLQILFRLDKDYVDQWQEDIYRLCLPKFRKFYFSIRRSRFTLNMRSMKHKTVKNSYMFSLVGMKGKISRCPFCFVFFDDPGQGKASSALKMHTK